MVERTAPFPNLGEAALQGCAPHAEAGGCYGKVSFRRASAPSLWTAYGRMNARPAEPALRSVLRPLRSFSGARCSCCWTWIPRCRRDTRRNLNSRLHATLRPCLEQDCVVGVVGRTGITVPRTIPILTRARISLPRRKETDDPARSPRCAAQRS